MMCCLPVVWVIRTNKEEAYSQFLLQVEEGMRVSTIRCSVV